MAALPAGFELVSCDADGFTIRTTTGETAVTGVGFQPDSVIIAGEAKKMKCPDCQDGYVELFSSREPCSTCEGTNKVVQPDFNIKGTVTSRMSMCDVDGLQRGSKANDIICDDAAVAAPIEERLRVAALKPVEWARMAQELLHRHPEWTTADIASKIGRTSAFVARRLNLLKLEPELARLVNAGRIDTGRAEVLARMSRTRQLALAPYAEKVTREDFWNQIRWTKDLDHEVS